MALEKSKHSQMTSEEAYELYNDLLQNLHIAYDSKSMKRATPFYLPEGQTLKYEGKEYIPFFVSLYSNYNLEDIVLSCRCRKAAGDDRHPEKPEVWIDIHPEKLGSHEAMKTLMQSSSFESQRMFTDDDRKTFAETFVDTLKMENGIRFEIQDPYYEIPWIELGSSSGASVKPRNSGRLNFNMDVNGLPLYGSFDYTVSRSGTGRFRIDSSSLKMMTFGNERVDVSEFLTPKRKDEMLGRLLDRMPPRVYYDSQIICVDSYKRENQLMHGLKKFVPGF